MSQDEPPTYTLICIGTYTYRHRHSCRYEL